MKLSDLVPNVEELLVMGNPQLAHLMLRCMLGDAGPEVIERELVKEHGQAFNLHPQHFANDLLKYGNRAREVELRLLEAWAWMEAEAILIRTDRNQANFGYNTLSLTGLRFYADSDARSLAATRRVNKHDLHPSLHREALPLFWQRSYDLSTYAALKAVEIAVRAASGLPDDVVGVDLMRKAFKEGGKLADPSLPRGEQEAISNLFAGAMGTFRNSTGHRYVNFDAETCADILAFASRLLHIVDRSAARAGG